MSLTKLSLGGNNLIRESLVSDIPDGDGKIDNLFYSVEGGLALMDDKVKEQVAGLELQYLMFVLYGNLVLDTQVSKIPIFVHQDLRMEVASVASNTWRESPTPRGL
jgi:hypothetical protein